MVMVVVVGRGVFYEKGLKGHNFLRTKSVSGKQLRVRFS